MFSRIAERYRGGTAVVIGAGGIGGAILRDLQGLAGRLVVGDRDEAVLQEIPEVAGTRLDRQRIDVADPDSVARFFQWADGNGPPDFLFHTAGILTLTSWQDLSTAEWDQAVDINLNGAYYCVREAAARMVPRKSGSIVVLGSIAGTRARSGSRVNAVYNATKAALSAFVNASAMPLRAAGVRINAISPGPTATPMMGQQPASVHQSLEEILLDRRQNSAEEVAELALFVAAHGRFTGEEISIGGGAGLGG